MTQLNEEHFEIIEKNKIERYERQKLTYLEDRMKGSWRKHSRAMQKS
jgi:hypothetical protein